MVSDKHILDPGQYYSFSRRMVTWSNPRDAATILRDVHWQLRYVELDNRWRAECQLPVRLPSGRIHTRAKHRVKNRHWMDMVEFPQIAKTLMNVRLTVGQDTDMEVRVRGSPTVQVKWYKNGLPLIETESVYVKNIRPDQYILTVRNVQRSDRGQYSCVASNMAGSVRTMGDLYVRHPYEIDFVEPKEEVVEEEEEVVAEAEDEYWK